MEGNNNKCCGTENSVSILGKILQKFLALKIESFQNFATTFKILAKIVISEF